MLKFFNKKLVSDFLYYSIIVLLPVLSHLFFSSLGYNPTDDGIYLSMARRILDGEIPHKDFLTYQPIGSAFLYLPFLIFSGKYTDWITRFFVWTQFIIMSLIWTRILIRTLAAKISRLENLLLIILSFMFSVNSYPIIAWYTIDGLFFATIGIYLILSKNNRNKYLGYFFVGLAYLFKQSYFLLGLLALVFLKDFINIKYWISYIFPALIYLGYLGINEVFHLALEQYKLVSNSFTFINLAIKNYLSNIYLVWGLFIGFFLKNFKLKIKLRFINIKINTLGLLLTVLVVIIFIIAYYLPTNFYAYYLTFGLFGLVLGLTFYLIETKQYAKAKAGIMLLSLAWSLSLSLSDYNPALISGTLLIFVLLSLKETFQTVLPKINASDMMFKLILIILAFITLNSFLVARKDYIFREKDFKYLNYSLDKILPGGNLIKTNENTYQYVSDLTYAVKMSGNLPYAVLPDFPGYWAKAKLRNPIKIYWAHFCDVSVCGVDSKNMYNALVSDLEAKRGKLVIIFSKVFAYDLANG